MVSLAVVTSQPGKDPCLAVHKAQPSLGVQVFPRLGLLWLLAGTPGTGHLAALSIPQLEDLLLVPAVQVALSLPGRSGSLGKEPCQELSLAHRSCSLSQRKGVQGLCQVRADPDPTGAGGSCPDTPALLGLSLPCPSLLISLMFFRAG